IPVPACCSEAGTLALSRPDIAHALCKRKLGALESAQAQNRRETILTNCPSCLQGLHRNAAVSGARPEHLAVDLARRAGGPEWSGELVSLFPDIEAVSF
ncbi:MAG: hypothetical protein HQL31_12215, partial [Planctomycetes bacterium]|nr:hypothetical protein [Planctomycetota bacterium]